MRLLIDTSGIQFRVAGAAKARPDFKDKEKQATTRDGLPIWTLRLDAIDNERETKETIWVEVAGDEPKLTFDGFAQVRGLVYAPWVGPRRQDPPRVPRRRGRALHARQGRARCLSHSWASTEPIPASRSDQGEPMTTTKPASNGSTTTETKPEKSVPAQREHGMTRLREEECHHLTPLIRDMPRRGVAPGQEGQQQGLQPDPRLRRQQGHCPARPGRDSGILTEARDCAQVAIDYLYRAVNALDQGDAPF